jgi:predicted membrane channel-forming protein YqfA (hemolysin III family)
MSQRKPANALMQEQLLASQLLRHSDMPGWFRKVVAPTIVMGYRPAEQTAAFYVSSLCWLSNESVNIWTHLLGACYFIAALAAVRDPYVAAYDTTALLCLSSSACFHLFMPYGELTYTRLQRADYAGIFILIGGSSIPIQSVQLFCHPLLQMVAVSLSAIAMVALVPFAATQAWFGNDTPAGKRLRLTLFVGYAAFCTLFGFWALVRRTIRAQQIASTRVYARGGPPYVSCPYTHAGPRLGREAVYSRRPVDRATYGHCLWAVYGGPAGLRPRLARALAARGDLRYVRRVASADACVRAAGGDLTRLEHRVHSPNRKAD